MKSAFEKPNCMFRSNVNHRDMVIEFFILRDFTFGLFVRRNNPSLDLNILLISRHQLSYEALTGYAELAQKNSLFSRIVSCSLASFVSSHAVESCALPVCL